MAVAQAAGFCSASRCIILGIKIKNQLSAGEIAEFNGTAFLVNSFERRGRHAFFKFHHDCTNFVIRVKFTKFELFSDYKVKIVINTKYSG